MHTSHFVLSLLLASAAVAQAPTTAQVSVGGLGTVGLQNQSDPPTLSGGTAASGELRFSFDQVSCRLTLTVENTSPVVAGADNPLITQVFFNLPEGLVDSISLVGQSGAGGATPTFSAVGANNVGSFGGFGYAIGVQGIQGGIANASATQWSGPGGAAVVGPVTFEFDVASSDKPNLTAQAFADAPSSGRHSVRAALKFQGGAVGDSGFIGTSTGCVPGVWMRGEPCLGNTITFYASNGVGCHNCLTISMNPGPFTLGNGVVLPGAPPYTVLWSVDAFVPVTGVPIAIPQDSNLIGSQIVLINATTAGDSLRLSTALEFTICP